MRVRFRPRAVRDLFGIAEYLVQESVDGAVAVESAIRSTIRFLADFPEIGRPLTARPDVRVIPVRRYPYLIFYEVSEDALFILHIRHGAREPLDPHTI